MTLNQWLQSIKAPVRDPLQRIRNQHKKELELDQKLAQDIRAKTQASRERRLQIQLKAMALQARMFSKRWS